MTVRPEPHAGLYGKWPAILRAYGAHEETLNGRQHPCPICGGKDRFRFDDRDGEGTWFCNHCGAGDGFTLLMAMQNLSFEGALKLAREEAHVVEAAKPKPVVSDVDKLRRLRRTWEQARRATPELLAHLASRGIPADMADDPMLRWHSCLSTGEDSAPAMLARYFNPGPVSCTIQRIWPSLKCKRTMPSPVKMHGAFCPLGGVPGDAMGVGEGIVTALAYRVNRRARGLPDFPTWSTYSAGQLEQFEPPTQVKQLHILVDVDYSYTGQASSFALAKRLRAERPELETFVEWPESMGRWDFDFADQLKEFMP